MEESGVERAGVEREESGDDIGRRQGRGPSREKRVGGRGKKEAERQLST